MVTGLSCPAAANSSALSRRSSLSAEPKPGAGGICAAQPRPRSHRDFSFPCYISPFTWRLADEMVQGTIGLAARGIREAAHRELHVVAKPPMQVFGDRNSRWGQRDLVRRRLALPKAWVGKLQQRLAMVVAQPGQDRPKLIPDRHDRNATRIHASAADSNGDSNSSSPRQPAATGDSA
jgi:hypothetical protein